MIRNMVLAALLCMSFLAGCGSQPPATGARQQHVTKVELEGFSKWQRVCDSERANPTFVGGKADISDSRIAADWANLYDRLRTVPDLEKVREVNLFFNRWTYKEDRDVWNKEDHWSTPREFMAFSGDCEDFAIAKYYALKELGMEVDRLRIAGVWNKKMRKGHAVLVVLVDGREWVLDNLSDAPVLLAELPHYAVQYHTNENSIWKREQESP